MKSHSQSRVLFDENIEIDPLQEVKVATHGNVEYYVEVKKGDFHAKVNSKVMFIVQIKMILYLTSKFQISYRRLEELTRGNKGKKVE